jgi:hypothetical protein
MATKNKDQKLTITDLNIWVLRKELAAGNGAIGKVPPTSAPHLRRCIKAGLLAFDHGFWRLTEKGQEILKTDMGK